MRTGPTTSTTPAAPYSSGTQATPLPDASTPRRSDGEDAVKRSVKSAPTGARGASSWFERNRNVELVATY